MGRIRGGGVKQSIYLPADLLAEVEEQAKRHDRCIGYMLLWVWRLAKEEIRKLPKAPK